MAAAWRHRRWLRKNAPLCPITLQPVDGAGVMASDGHWYNGAALERWAAHNNTSPLTRERLVRGVDLAMLRGRSDAPDVRPPFRILTPDRSVVHSNPQDGPYGVPRRHIRRNLRR